MDHQISIADKAAQAVLTVNPVFDSEDVSLHFLEGYWPLLGAEIGVDDDQPTEDHDERDAILSDHVAKLAEFVRAYPDAPLEAMYRHAAGQGIHSRPADGFDDIEPAFRIAYEVFRSTLLTADRVFADEEARAAAKARAAAAQAPVIVPVEDTILARGGGIMDRIGDAPEMVNLGGPVVAASTEGEGGDGHDLASAHGNGEGANGQPLSEAAAAGAHPHGSPAAEADRATAAEEAPRDHANAAPEAPVNGDGDAQELVSQPPVVAEVSGLLGAAAGAPGEPVAVVGDGADDAGSAADPAAPAGTDADGHAEAPAAAVANEAPAAGPDGPVAEADAPDPGGNEPAQSTPVKPRRK